MALTDRAIGEIKAMIQAGDLQPGDRLPPEGELSERLGLSRSSLREAVKALEAMRVLDVRRGDGTYVTSLEPRLLLEAMSFVLDFHQSHAVLEVFEVRRILETSSAALAADHATPEQVAGLRESLAASRAASDIEDLVEHDRDFHARIADSTGNGYLAGLLGTVSDKTVRARIWRGLTQDRAVDKTLAEHEAIIAAIETGNSELARALMLVHVAGVEDWLHANVDDSTGQVAEPESAEPDEPEGADGTGLEGAGVSGHRPR
ncbi:FCD domain-containing protein [Pseudactinotalea sp. HY160]|uniref:FadR/GntR family transcriptional regulator n=1 Tax=Pseudactinotalea sp. HY160 TaxID=2654490 RepID=UPI00128C995F|nr:FadR/GntR family transcriptional regulator [Pseudactinotalea sp. HY160]MPV48491.1 FCD domain-containing protein [Pseudactinotalea sp. HY160]